MTDFWQHDMSWNRLYVFVLSIQFSSVTQSCPTLCNPGIESRSPELQADSLPAEPQGKPKNTGLGSLPLLQQISPWPRNWTRVSFIAGGFFTNWAMREAQLQQRGKERKRKEKKCKRIYRTNQKLRTINIFLESLLSESFPSLGVTVHLTSLGCPPTLCWSLDLLWGQLRF